MKLLSIVIPHYNNPFLLEKLLESIPLIEEIEVIVVDDRSDKYIHEYEELTLSEKFRTIIFVTNGAVGKGAGAARNVGMDEASGKWVLFADADDYFASGFYSIVKKYFNTDNDCIIFKLSSIYLDSGQSAERHVFYNKLIDEYDSFADMQREVALRYLHNPPYGKMISRKFLLKNNIRFDEVIASNDVMFSVKVGYHMKQFEIDTNVIYCITRGKGSLTMNIEEHIYDTRLDVFINYYNYLKDALPKEQFRALNLYGWSKLVDVIKYRLGFKKLVTVTCKLKRNKVNIFDLRLFNPFITVKKFFYYIKRYNNEKKYMEKG